MNFFYKLASERDENPARHASTFAGTMAGAGAATAANLGALAIASPDWKKGTLSNAKLNDKKRLSKYMDDLASAHGYQLDVDNMSEFSSNRKYKDISGKNRPSIDFDPTYASYSGAHMATMNDDSRHIHLGRSRSSRSKGTLAHEFGHAMQNKKQLEFVHKAQRLYGPAASGLMASALLRTSTSADSEFLDKVDAGLATVGTAGFLPTIYNEIDASRRGSVTLGTAPTRWGRIKQRAQAFKGVPTYIAAGSIPAAMYFGGKWAREAANKKADQD